MPPDVPLPNFDGGTSSQDSVLSENQSVGRPSRRKVPLVDLAGSPTSKRRQPSSVSSRRTPRRPDLTPGFHADDDPVWVPSSVPTRLTNGYRHRGGSSGGSPSKSLEMELTSSVPSNKPVAYTGQFAHSRVAALQSHGRTPVYLRVILAYFVSIKRLKKMWTPLFEGLDFPIWQHLYYLGCLSGTIHTHS